MSPQLPIHFFANLGPPSNTDLIRHLSSTIEKGAVNENIFILSWVTLSPKFTCGIFQSIEKGIIWYYNRIGDSEGSISHSVHLDSITGGFF